MFYMNILLFLAVLISSTSKSSPTPIRNGAFSKEPAQQFAGQIEQDTRMLEFLEPLAISRRGTIRDALTDETSGVQESSSPAHRKSIRSVSNGNETIVLKEHVFKNSSDDQISCEHRLDGSSGTLSSYQMEEFASCKWNLSAPNDFSITVVLAVLQSNDSSFALVDSGDDLCLPNGTRVVFTDYLPHFQPKQTVFCEVKSAQIVAFSFTTLGNKVSIDVYNQPGSQVVWALYYQAIDESLFEIPFDVSGSAGVITELSTSSYDLRRGGESADQCFEFNGTTVKPKEGAVGRNETCSVTFSPDFNQEVMLSFFNTDVLGPIVTNCSSEDAFITVRTWSPDGNITETSLCSIPLAGARFTSPVRIELNYHPSSLTLQDFIAEINSVIPDSQMNGAELLRLLLQNTLVYSLTDERGLLATLGYPSQFPGMRMIWEITVGEGKGINLEFVDIDVGYTPPSTCNATTPIFVIILSPSRGDQQVYCGSLPPRNITSTGNRMILIFDPRSSGRGVGNGIQAAYTSFDNQNNTFQGTLDINDVWMLLSELPIPPSVLGEVTTMFADCQFLFMKDSGNFTRLDYPINNTIDYNACWHILSGPSEFMKNLFSNFPLLDFLVEGDEVQGTSPGLLGTSFADDEMENFRGNFDIDVSVTPTVPFSRGKTVSFSTEPITSLSTEQAPISTTETGSSTVFARCTHLITDDSGNFTTLNYPNDYPANYTSCWYISTDPSRFIMIRFRNFSLDSAQVDPCDRGYSFVTIDDFVADTVDLCGTLENQMFKSSSNTVKIDFNGMFGQGHGFYAIYETFKISSYRSHVAEGNIGSCNATERLERLTVSGNVRLPALMSKCAVNGDGLEWFTETEKQSGWFASPLFPGQYLAGSHCRWIVRAEENMMVNINFFDFDLGEAKETYPPCGVADTFILIRDCVSGEEQSLCGIRTQTEQLLIPSNSVEIEFYSGNGNGKGFQAFYNLRQSNADGKQYRVLPENQTPNPESSEDPIVVPDPLCEDADSDKCGGNLQSEYGYIASAFYPTKFQYNTNCIWTITSSLREHKIALKILDIDLGGPVVKSECELSSNGYLKVDISGYSTFTCNNHGPNLFVSDEGFIRLEFFSENGIGRGFCAAFMSIEPSFSGSISNLHFPCLCDGLYPNGSLIVPPTQPLTSTLRSEVDVVTTDPLCEDAGSNKCGGNVQSEFGYLSSTLFPKEFQYNINCIWIITSYFRDHQVALKILDVDLGGPVVKSECELSSNGYLKVDISGYSTFVCNNYGPNLFVSDEGVIRLEFFSENGIGRGFCVAFTSIETSFSGNISDLHFPCLCEGLYPNGSLITQLESTEPKSCEFIIGEGSGTLPSESFPIPYPPNLECVWTLLAEPGEYVNLHFLSLDLDEFRVSRRRRCLLSDTHVQITLFKETQVLNKRFCSDDDWSMIIPSSRDVTIKFASGDIPDHNYTGFRMAYNFTRVSSEVIRQDLPENVSVSESVEANFGFRVFFDYDEFSSVDFPDEEVIVETGRRTTEGDRTRLIWPVEAETDIPELGVFTDYATVLPDVYGTDLPGGLTTTIDEEADILTTTSTSERPHPSNKFTTTSLTSTTSGVIPAKGQMTAREMELTIYICTGLAAFLIVVLILVTLYCAKNRRSNSKDGFNVDAAEEANYWQTYKDWAKDYVTEPVAGSAQSTVGAMYGDEGPPKRVPTSGDEMAADDLSPGHTKTVSAVVNQPPMDKPERNFIPSEKLV